MHNQTSAARFSRFDKFANEVLDLEGNYVDHPADKGGPTKFGISQRSYPNVNIKTLTVVDAKSIYYRDYYVKSGASTVLNSPISYMLLDFAINSGVKTAVQKLQELLRASTDGFYGPRTRNSVNTYGDQRVLFFALSEERRKFYRAIVANNPSQEVFLQGWYNRIDKIVEKFYPN